MSRSELSLAVAKVLAREGFSVRHDRALQFKREGRAAAIAKVPEWQWLREHASTIKAEARERMEDNLRLFRENAEARGAQVHEAPDAEACNEIVLGILQEHGVRSIVKSKSMTTEECGLNPCLEREGMEVTDTDLGERIVQLFGEPPSHIVTPAVHRSREEIGVLFHRLGLCEEGETDPTRLTWAARAALREIFLHADAGITGANLLVAESGTAVVVENEANSLLGTSLPDLHIVVAGIDKLVTRDEDLATILALLARSATGQRITSYTTHYRGPAARSEAEVAAGLHERELHIVLLDNGRRALRGTPGEDALSCIRCGACLTACPVFRRVGGHAYDWVIPGPIGEVLGPGLAGKDELPKASPLCGLCSEVCPVKIPLARRIHDWRGELVAQGRASSSLPMGLGLAMKHPRLWRSGLSVMKWGGRLSGAWLRRDAMLRAFEAGGDRRLPAIPTQDFRTWFRKRATATPLSPEEGVDLSALPKAVALQEEASPARLAAPEPAPKDLESLFGEALVEGKGELLDLAGLEELCASGEPLLTGAAREQLTGILPASASWPRASVVASELSGSELLIATARWRVARTGSLWVDFSDLESRAQLLLSEGLILLVPRAELVFDLPQHYRRLGEIPSCGTLVTGPSKTADIELCLVIGAHGPKRLYVLPV